MVGGDLFLYDCSFIIVLLMFLLFTNTITKQLSSKIPKVRECSCKLISDSSLRAHVVSNIFKDKGKLLGRYLFIMGILDKAGLGKELSSYSMQIVARTIDEDRRRKQIYAELQPDYVPPPARKTKSSKGGASSKKRSATTTTPLATKSNVKSRTKADDEFIVDDDDDISECSWNSSDEESMADEQDDDSESDNEFDKMMVDDDASAGDINLDSDTEDADDSDNEDADKNCFHHCVCGNAHGTPFWLQCDGCDAWYHVEKECVGFDEDEAENKDNWYCRECMELVADS